MIELWHGGRRWEGHPEVRAPKQGRYECGPGIYLTNRYERARKYAQGGGVTTRVDLPETVRWLEKTMLPLASMVEYVRETRGLRNKREILADLQHCADRMKSDQLCANVLVNLCVNHEAVAGKPGILLAEWLARQGIDASLHTVDAQEEWVIVFNPEIIKKHRVVPASEVNGQNRDFPRVTEQLEALAK